MRHWGIVLLATVACGVSTDARVWQGIFRTRAEIVVIDAFVADGRAPVSTLTRDDFELLDNGVAQSLLDLDRERQPLDVTVTIDLSGSMTPAKRTVVERAMGQVSAALEAGDRGAITTFATRIVELMPLQAPPLAGLRTLTQRGRVDLGPAAPVPGVFQAAITSVGTGTAIMDALLLSLVTAPAVDRRQLNLLMTDGDDTTSYFDARTVVETAQHASAQTSFVIVRDDGRLKNNATRQMFRSVADTTGGTIVDLEPGDDLSAAFLTAIENFRTSYVLRYSPAGVSTPGWHDVAVKVKSKKYSVRARRGYWADAKTL
jgi:VWFA-related protein